MWFGTQDVTRLPNLLGSLLLLPGTEEHQSYASEQCQKSENDEQLDREGEKSDKPDQCLEQHDHESDHREQTSYDGSGFKEHNHNSKLLSKHRASCRYVKDRRIPVRPYSRPRGTGFGPTRNLFAGRRRSISSRQILA